MVSIVEVPVFTETNLGTHIAIAVSPNITAGDFKRELEKAHFNCFPKLGEIRVYGLMVKRKSCFYHLPDSMPIMHAFQGLKGTWFFRMEASPLNGSDRPGLSKCLAAGVVDHISDGCNVTVHLSKKKKKRKRVMKNHFVEYTADGIVKKCLGRNEELLGVATKGRFGFSAFGNQGDPRDERNSSPMVETPGERSSEVISVTCIIKRYFSNHDEVSRCGSPSSSDVTSKAVQNRQNRLEEQLKFKKDDNGPNIQVGDIPQFTAKTPLKMLPFPSPSPRTSTDKLKRTQVGKRLVMASNSLGISARKQRPAISLCRFKDRKLSAPNSSLVRNLVFEISDGDD